MASEEPQILRPRPQRPFVFSTSPGSSQPSSPTNELASQSSASLQNDHASLIGSSPVERTRSILNLTASTLYGIYAPDDDTSVFGYTPMPTNGATTPAYPPTPSLLKASNFEFEPTVHDHAVDRMAPVIGALEQPHFRRTPSYQRAQNQGSSTMRVVKGLVRAVLLFALGVVYGTVVTHLHDARNVAPVKLDGLNRSSAKYTIFWGIAGIVLGTALPVVDAIWEREDLEEKRERLLMQKGALKTGGASGRAAGGTDQSGEESSFSTSSPLVEAVGLGAEWNPMVRSIGAFVGIGFAIRKLPWQSTLQASLTLSMVNPCLWYTIDRSAPGFALSAVVGLFGTMVLLGTEVVPMPAIVRAGAQGAGNGSSNVSRFLGSSGIVEGRGGDVAAGIINEGTFAVWVWIASVLFCSSLCFGNIGRRLALGMNWK